MRSDHNGSLLAAPLRVAAMLLLSGAPLASQAVDTLTQHSGAHAMGWGRETMVLSEVLEYAPSVAARSVDYDLAAWMGGAVHRAWAKVDGGLATVGQGRHGEYQVLYGRLVSPFWDAQIGVRVDERVASGNSVSRAGAVVGLQGLAPGWFEVEPALFVTTDGNVSFDLSASYDLFVTQRIVLQPRLESAVALRDEPAFGLGRGLVNTSFGLRTRFELRREFAPYVGVVWDRTYGRTARIERQAGSPVGEARFVAGLRLWR